MLCGVLMITCTKHDAVPTDPSNPNPPPTTGNQTDSTNADTISNHLRFFNATKKQAIIPKGPSGSSLKISFKDTLYMMDELKRPIKFLHEDTTQDVAGAFVQVHAGTGGGASSFYYDVPEEPLMADNDTVSVILVGIDPNGLIGSPGVPPAGGGEPLIFDVTIIPYDGDGQPLGSTTRPVKIDNQNINPNSGKCGLVLPPGDYWDWDLSLIEDPNGTGLAFYNDPYKIWGEGGQFINGCCIDGVSSYDINCASNTNAFKKLRFPTFFRFIEESIKFFNDGTFARFTKDLYVNPAPDLSDFCGNGLGVVYSKQYSVAYFGNWTIEERATPFNGDSLNLQLRTTSSAGGSGRGRNGGIIHQLDCNTLALINPDNEGFSSHLVSYFFHVDKRWYPLI